MMRYLFLFMFFQSISGFAQTSFSEISYSGSGCPVNSVQILISPDEESLSFLFDEFRSEVPNRDLYERNSRDRRGNEVEHISLRSCALSFKAFIPENYKIESVELSFEARGSAIFDAGVEGLFASILVGYQGLANSGGRTHTIVQKKWRSSPQPIEEDFFLAPKSQLKMNSSCSRNNQSEVRFDIKNHLKTEISSGDLSKQGLLILDSVDSRKMLKIKIKKSICRGGRVSPVRRSDVSLIPKKY